MNACSSDALAKEPSQIFAKHRLLSCVQGSMQHSNSTAVQAMADGQGLD